jgi:hypothetical protein
LYSQGRLRRVFSDHLHIVIEWHAVELGKAMTILLEQDEAAGWRPTAETEEGGQSGAARLSSARGLMLECRRQVDNATTVLSQSESCIGAFGAALTGVFKVCAAPVTTFYKPQAFMRERVLLCTDDIASTS